MIGRQKWIWILVSVALVTALLPTQATALTNASIAAKAQNYRNGQYGGQCIVWVANVLRSVSGGRIKISAYTSGYQGTYRANGAKQVSSSAATGGDVIQVTPAGTSDSWKGPEHPPLHTAIILSNRGGGNFSVIDSNARLDERVLRHNYNPFSGGGRTVRIWRFGSVSTPKPTPPPPTSVTGDGVGYYDPADYSFHLRNSPSAGPSDYIFVRGKPGIVPLIGNWDGK